MVRIRWHGRGGQGIKTGSRILGNAFFHAGFEVQDAPVYGAERRGAPMSATVRAALEPILERGVIEHPDLLVLADPTLLDVPAASVLQGVSDRTLMLVHGGVADVARRLADQGCRARCLAIAPACGEDAGMPGVASTRCAGAAARLAGTITREQLASALREELAPLGAALVERNLAQALDAFDALAAEAGSLREGIPASASGFTPPDWITLPLDAAHAAAPAIYAAATTVLARTGLWRTMRPEIDYAHCKRCAWVCATLCPDSAIRVRDDRSPEIDLVHCKGCLICVAVCPPHAIRAVAERSGEALSEAAA